jgi:spermidine synthase
MLFAMGLGSQWSKYVKQHVLRTFIAVEFSLSLLISISPLVVYGLAGYTQYTHIIVYGFSMLIGLCIGFEIPLVTRLNEQHEGIATNVSNVMSWDYIGSLIGGIAFAFWGLPVLGIKNTAFFFGAFNLMAALLLVFVYRNEIKTNGLKVVSAVLGVISLLICCFYYSPQIMLYGEQKQYKDKIVYRKESPYQKLVVTEWLDSYWLYINGNLQLSTQDEFLYHEPMTHPVMQLSKVHKDILVIGGGDGFNVKEILKYTEVEHITVVDLDPAMTELGSTYPPFVAGNENSLNHPKVAILNEDGFVFLQKSKQFYDVIIVDLPDAKGIDLNKLYTKEFYELAQLHLRPNGHIVTQAGSPYFATRAFHCIDKTIKSANFSTLKIHNQVMSMGEWGWIIGSKALTTEQMIHALHADNFPQVKTKWINAAAVDLITSFGMPLADTTAIEINTINDPVLYQYQLKANWDLY